MDPKPFQCASIKAAVRALNTGARRFLLADEVGLGKTVVAKEAIWALANEKKTGEPFRVFYFSSSQTLSAQNAPRLRRDKEAGEHDLLEVSRPSLLPNGSFPAGANTRIQIFRFFPDTALPILKKKARGGVTAERALLYVLRARVLKWRFPQGLGLKEVFKGRASKSNFFKEVRAAAARYRNRTLLRGYNFSAAFLIATRAVLALKAGESLQDKLDALGRSDPRNLLGKLRIALTLASLECLPPDLIIFDEFHRYQDKAFRLPAETSDGQELSYSTFLQLLPAAARPRLLLLSATPFRLTNASSERSSSRADATLFHRLVGFLHGDGVKGTEVYRQCSKAFRSFEAELAAEKFSSPQLLTAKRELEEQLLRPRMARMERAVLSKADHSDLGPSLPEHFPTLRDLSVLSGFARGLRDRDKGAAVTFWRSIPLPHQTMGSSYVMWDKAPSEKKKRWCKLPGISRAERNSMRVREEAYHPKFRELLKQFPPERLALPWIAPSSPWWSLKGPWAKSERQGEVNKGLLFSHYRAVPAAVAGLVSLGVEEWASRRMGWKSSKKLSKRTFLPTKSISNIVLFHPSVWLASNVDPKHYRHDDRKGAVASVARHLKCKLDGKVTFDPKKKTQRPLWQVLSLIEQRCAAAPGILDVWKVVGEGKKKGDRLKDGLYRIATTAADDEAYVTGPELRALAWFALTAPGVVLLRSVARKCVSGVLRPPFCLGLDL